VKPLWAFLRSSLGIAADLFAVLLECRLSTLLTILGFVFFVLVGQGREFVEALGSETEDPRYWAHQLFFLAAVLIWFGTTWLTDALFNTRVARGTYSQSLTREFVEANAPGGDKRRRYFHFGLKQEKFAPPLGWFLSAKSRCSIDAQRRELIQSDPKFQELLAVLK
jgi:hypothetical protein